MGPYKTRLVALFTVFGLAACIGLATAADDRPPPPKPSLPAPPPNKDRAFLPSKAIFPDQTLPLRFFHDKHLAQEVDCGTCHTNADTSVSAKDVLIPTGKDGEEVCTTCHDFSAGEKGTPPAACSTCHGEGYVPTFPDGAKPHESLKATEKPTAMHIPTPNLKMNHKIHLDKGITCETCHGTLKDVTLATRDNALPVMGTCLQCHDGRTAPSECRTCHLTRPDGRLQTTLSTPDGLVQLQPMGRYRNDAHDDAWLKNHATSAKNDEAYCATCHEEKYCLKCHNGVSKPMKVHPNNWTIIHPAAARRNDPSCSSCHRAQSFCLDCHKRVGVAGADEFDGNHKGKAYNGSGKLGKFHPDGWVGDLKNGAARGPDHHAFQAQRNIRQCAACHTENTCLTCHKGNSLQGVGVSPHPPGFKSSAKCRALKANNERVCAKCHKTPPECQ